MVTHQQVISQSGPVKMNATSGESFDTESDFADAERHLLQKLFIWKGLASSTAEFRQK